jgi:hypothetical protein
VRRCFPYTDHPEIEVSRAPQRSSPAALGHPPDRAFVRTKQSGGATQQRRFSRVRRSDESDNLAPPKPHVDVGQRRNRRDTRAGAGRVALGHAGHDQRIRRMKWNWHGRTIAQCRRTTVILSPRDGAGPPERRRRSPTAMRPRNASVQALARRPARSAAVTTSNPDPGARSTPPVCTGTRSTSGRSRVVRRNPCPS